MRALPLPSGPALAVLAPCALTLLLTGCGSDDPDKSAEAGRTPTAARTSAGPSAESSATPTPASSSPATRSPSPRKAADGTDVSACADGTCEVEVGVGDVIGVDGGSGRQEFRLDSIGEGGAVVAVGPFDNPMTTTVNGRVEINGVSLEITPKGGKRAIAKVS